MSMHWGPPITFLFSSRSQKVRCLECKACRASNRYENDTTTDPTSALIRPLEIQKLTFTLEDTERDREHANRKNGTFRI